MDILHAMILTVWGDYGDQCYTMSINGPTMNRVRKHKDKSERHKRLPDGADLHFQILPDWCAELTSEQRVEVLTLWF